MTIFLVWSGEVEPRYYKNKYWYCKVLDNETFFYSSEGQWQKTTEWNWTEEEKNMNESHMPYEEVSRLEVLVVLGLT
jgi:hypothetical protein